MTERLLQKLFADVDPHKKGYLTETDWNNAFSKQITATLFHLTLT